MKAGDYIRTSSGKIAKYLGHEGDKYKFDEYIYWYYEYYNDYVYDEDYEEWLKEEEVKVYKKLIDLIEVGDYVNGYKVIDFMLENGKTKGIIVDGDIWGFDIDEIKSIVTKEQFGSIKYKVKE